MRRFPLLRGFRQGPNILPREPGHDRGRLRRRDDVIEGAFVWAHDPAFRPLIAIYADGRLRQLGTTYRRAIHERRSWPCCFSIELDEELADREDLTVAVFETGDVLQPPQPGEKPVATVEDLIEAGYHHARPFAFGGFVSFLLLPLNDQIQILCRDLLDRDAAETEIEAYRQRVIDGDLSILGVRDDIALSDEAKETCGEMTLHERRGRACLWLGLDQALDCVVPPPLGGDNALFDTPLSLRSAFEEITTPSDVRSILAFNAVGETTDIGAFGQWATANQDIVAAVEARVSRSVALREKTPSRRYRLGNLLAAMTVGNAAVRRADGAVSAHAGSEGVVVYGPYMSLEPGHHTVLFSVQNEAPAERPLRLCLDVVYGDILFARREIVLSAAVTDVWSLALTVPSGQRDLLGLPNFEFRIATNGAADVSCDFIALDVCNDADVGTSSRPSVENWLPLMSPEAAGRRLDDGTLRALARTGRVFFGPYCKLLPGRYALTLDYEFTAGDTTKEAEFEVVDGPDSILAWRRFALVAGGGREELRFEITEAETADELAGPLEFRLWKEADFEFHCLAVGLAVLGERDA